MFQVWESDFLLLAGKIFFMAMSILYAIFAFMVVRQVSLMNKSFTTSLHSFFTLLAWLHFLMAVIAVFVVFIVL
jgi:hypothetical protein